MCWPSVCPGLNDPDALAEPGAGQAHVDAGATAPLPPLHPPPALHMPIITVQTATPPATALTPGQTIVEQKYAAGQSPRPAPGPKTHTACLGRGGNLGCDYGAGGQAQGSEGYAGAPANHPGRGYDAMTGLRRSSARRAWLQPCRISHVYTRALAPEVRFSTLAPTKLLGKTVPQRLKPFSTWNFTARLKPCPSSRPPRELGRTVPQRLKPFSTWNFTARLKPCPSSRPPRELGRTVSAAKAVLNLELYGTAEALPFVQAPT